MNRRLIYLLIICFCLSILGLAVHHHADGVSHDTCLLCCHVSHHSVFIPHDNPQISSLPSNASFISVENTLNSPYLCYQIYLNRAPPLKSNNIPFLKVFVIVCCYFLPFY